MLKTDMTGRVADIAGSGSALDLALVKAFTENGAQVALCCKPEERPDAAALESYKDKVEVFDLNLLDFESIQPTVEKVIAHFGKIDILVNNPMGTFTKYDRVTLHEMKLDVSTCYLPMQEQTGVIVSLCRILMRTCLIQILM